jgi:hypothetical protein
MVAGGMDPIAGLRARQGIDTGACLPSVETGTAPLAAVLAGPVAAAVPDSDESPASPAPQPPKTVETDVRSTASATKNEPPAAAPVRSEASKLNDADTKPVTATQTKNGCGPDTK